MKELQSNKTSLIAELCTWHKRLFHLNCSVIKEMTANGVVQELKIEKSPVSTVKDADVIKVIVNPSQSNVNTATVSQISLYIPSFLDPLKYLQLEELVTWLA